MTTKNAKSGASAPLPDFDAQWYAETYADVGLSGLDPETHYRLIGRMLGRPGRPGSARAAALARPRLP